MVLPHRRRLSLPNLEVFDQAYKAQVQLAPRMVALQSLSVHCSSHHYSLGELESPYSLEANAQSNCALVVVAVFRFDEPHRQANTVVLSGVQSTLLR